MDKLSLKKQALMRGIFGIFAGILVGYFICILVSFVYGNGYFTICHPKFIEIMGNEINAVIVQTLLCGFLGFCYSFFSIIYEIEKISLLKQTFIYYIILLPIQTTIAYFAFWLEHSFSGFLSHTILFTILFVICWFVSYFIYSRQVKIINKKIKS